MVDRDEKHLPTLVCEDLVKKASSQLEKVVQDKDVLAQIKGRAKAQLREWTDEIYGSEADPYRHEVNQRREGEDENASGPQPKRVIKEVVFDETWRLNSPANAASSSTATQMPVGMPAAFQPIAPNAVLGVSMPPPPVVVVSWHLSVSGQTYGPYPIQSLQAMIPTGQFTLSTLVWRDGMAAWAPAGSMPELVQLFTPSPGGGVPPPPPPVV
jgi:hypothetical protein